MADDVASPVAVVCHDAGAANVLCARLANTPGLALRFCAAGPAVVIADRLFPGFVNLSLPQALSDAKTLISGTGWGSNLEREARLLARAHGIRSIAVVDHWVNYAARFTHEGTVTLPDQIWVFDRHAEAEARRCFPGIPVSLETNFYLDAQVEEITALRRQRQLLPEEHILYVLEPIRSQWGTNGPAGEFQALTYFFENLSRLVARAPTHVRLRPHPSDPPGKYDAWVGERAGVYVTIEDRLTLAESLAWADWVVGCETYALVVALHAGCRVASSLPPWAPALRLPYPEILQLRQT